MHTEFEKKKLFTINQYEQEREYWIAHLSGEIIKAGFPVNNESHGPWSPKFETLDFRFPAPLFDRLMTIINHSDSRLNVTLVLGITLLLYKYTGNKDIIVGIPIEKQEIDGQFINTVLPIRSRIDDQRNVKEFLMQVKQTIIDAEKNQNYPIETIPFELGLPMTDGPFPLFDTAVLLRNIHDKRYLGNIKLNMLFSFLRTENALEGTIEYNAMVFDRLIVEQLVTHFLHVMQEAFFHVDMKLVDVPLLTEDEKKAMIFAFNKTDQDYPRDKMIHQLVEEQVERTPEHIAVESQGKRVTYRELNENANRLARVLREKGAVADTVTAILLDRSEDVPLAFLAVLKAGGAYLPIGNEYPEDRIDYILTDSRAKLRLMHRSRSEGKNSGLPVLYLDDATSFASGAENLEPVNTVNSLAYIIYTSGTTGRPKGVMIEHRGLVNYISWAARTYVGDEKNEKNETSNKVDFALYTSISFDLTVTSVFTPLVTGNTMIAYGGIDKKLYIDDVIDDNRVGVLKLTPSHLKLIRSKKVGNSSIKRLIVGGEELETELAREIYQNFDRKIDIYNEYGPTETVVGSMIYRFDPLTDTRHAVPIGVPIANTQIYILNEYLQPVPVGVAGELYIGGDGLARGYLFNPEMTEAKFVPDPFIPGRKMYKTGDLAVRLTDGMIEYKGRIDHQVKIRGYRVETGEIEVKIIDYLKTKTVQPGSVKIECVITDIKDEMGEKTLCAYICSETAFNIAELKDALGRELPDYMIPTYYVKLDEIPLASSGKVDRKSLPKPKLSLEEGYIAPRNGVEEKLVQVWSEVLDIETEKIGIDANFFEVGGHSLKATFLTAGIQRHFSVKLPLVKIFEKPTIRGQAELLKDAVREIFIAIDRVEEKEYYVLSSAQRRLYILQQMDPNAVAYNVSVIVELEGDIEKKKLEETFRQLADRHESLKTAIISVNGMPVQTIAQAFRIDIAYFDSDSPLRTEEAIRNFKRPFDLSQAPLMRVGLITIDRMRHVLMVELHHLITDGISQDLLVNDFMCLYKDIQLPGLKLQYKDYSEWQQRESFRESIRKQEAFWVTECEDEIPLLNLPVDYKRPLVQSVEGDTLRFEIGKDDTAALNAIAQRENATLFMVLLAVYQVFLSKICGQENIIVGTPIAGRRHADLEKIVGMFVNTLALRAVPSGEKTFNDFLDEVRTTTFNAFENQDYQFEELVDRIAIKRDLSRNPIFDTLFVLQNTFKPSGDALDKEFVGLKVKPYVYGNKTSKFDLSLIAFEHEGTLHFNFEYCTRIFKAETIVRFIACFKKVVETVIQDGNTRISEIEIISEAEREQVLYRFNDPASDYPSDKTIHQLFEEQVERTPDQNALSALSPTPRQLTYNELNAWSDQLAQELVEKGVQPNTIVAIRMERSIEMIVCILGILKAGGAYLPIDPQAPEDRVNYMLTDSGARLVLATEVTEDTEKGVIEVKKLRSSEGKKGPAGAHIGAPLQREIHVGADPRVCPSASFLPASGNRQPATSLAYIIYTSGSTGRPKGVPISHANLSPLLHWGYKELGLGSSDRALQNVSYYFDWSVWEIFIMLTTGGSLYPVPGELLLNPEACITFIRENGMTVLHATPSQYQYFMDTGQKLDTLNYLFLGAEKLAVDFLRRSFESVNDNCRVFNMYGPTEATIISAVLEIERGTESRFETLSSVPIGRGVGNTHLFVWDRYLNLCPVNVAGELYISGDGVSAGYLNNPELTAEKFTGSRWPVAGSFNPTPKNNRTPKNTNPKTKSFWSHLFSKRWAAGGILYKTGDLVRWVSGGYVEYLGRIDQQVKVRGFRIELEEIENQLLRNKQIKDAVVMLTETGHTGKDEDAAITAYIVSSEPLLASDCRLELMKTLPAYMVPAAFIQVDKIPLTPNGKADKKALALLGQKLGTGETQVLPQTEIEKSIAGAWQDVLKLDTVGIYDNFFDIGGNSIKIIQVSARLKQQLGMNIPINKMFHYPTIHGLADYLEQWNRNETSVMETEGEVRERVTVWENVEEELSKNLRLTSLLKKNNLYRSYDVSSPQLSFLLNIKQIERQNIAFSYDLYHSNEAEGDDKIQRIVIQMINQNALLRSVIVNQSGLFVVEEYDSYMNIDIPFIDLSKDPVDYQEDVQGMIAAYLEQPFEVIDRVLFRVAVVKLSENHYRLLFVFNHLVFDGGSYSVLEEQIEQARKEVNEGSDRTRNSIDSYDYYDYAAFLNQLNYDTINLENHLPVSTYLRQVDRVRDVFDKRQLQRVSFEVDLSMLKPEKQHLYHEILFFAYARLIGDLYGIANVPLIFYSYGRNYKNGNFNKMIGTFQDFVPVLIDLKEKPGLVLEAFLAYREYIKEVDLNFTNFIRKKYREREEYVKLMATPFKFNPIFGIYERLKHTAEEGVAPALDPQRFGSDTIICELMASKDTHSEKVMLRLVHNTPFGVAEWTEKFIEYVKTVVDYFNTTM